MYRELLTHPKLRRFMKSSGMSRNEAVGTLFSVWAWGVDNAERNGLILEADRRDIADVISAGSGLTDGVNPSKVVDCMIESGWIDEDERDGNLRLHDWDEWQDMYYRFIDKREKDTARKRRAREAEKSAAGQPLPPPPDLLPAPEPDPVEEPKGKPKRSSNQKPEKKKYADYVSMTEVEHGKLISEYGEAAANRMIDVMNNYKGATGKTYKSDYLAILNWVVGRVREESPGIFKPKSSSRDEDLVPKEWRNFRRGEA